MTVPIVPAAPLVASVKSAARTFVTLSLKVTMYWTLEALVIVDPLVLID